MMGRAISGSTAFFLRKPLDAVARSEHRLWPDIARKRTQGIAELFVETVTALQNCGRAPNRTSNTSQTHTNAEFLSVHTHRLLGI